MISKLYIFFKKIIKSMAKTEEAKAPLISQEEYFWTCDGRVLGSLEELATALKEMDDGAFKHHVNKEKNDFVKWVKEVLKDNKLVQEMKRSKTRLTMLKKVEARIKELK